MLNKLLLPCCTLVLSLLLNTVQADAAEGTLTIERESKITVTYSSSEESESETQSETNMESDSDSESTPAEEQTQTEEDGSDEESEEEADCGCSSHLQTFELSEFINCVMNEILETMLESLMQPIPDANTES